MQPQVDVGVVTWNTASVTTGALRRLLDTDQGCDLRVMVFDNASEDGTADAIAANVPEVEVIRSSDNIGFARGVNQLLGRSDASWFLALNSDAWPEPGALARLVEAGHAHPRAAAVAARLLRPDGALEHSTHPFPTPGLALIDALGLRAVLPNRWAAERCLERAWAHDRPRQVDWAVGAGLLMRRTAVEEVGGFDERFFLYVEDLEWCWRAQNRGWQIWFEPGAVIRHVGNVSGQRRFGEARAALEDANLRLFTEEALGPRRARLYHALQTAAVARQYATARVRADVHASAYWRTQLRAALTLLPPPAIRPPAEVAGTEKPRALSPPDEESSSPVDVSVVIATRGRANLLSRLVEALEKQSLPMDRFEVVVVQDGPSQGTEAEMARLAETTGLRLRVMRTPRRQGPAVARNLGWRASDAPVVAFTDDDCTPDPDWLRSGLTALDNRSRIAVGRTEPPAEQSNLEGEPFARVLRVNSTRFFETSNLFCRRSDLEAVGGFDERFGWPSGEDTHLGIRIVEMGVEPVFAGDALVHHDVRLGGARAALREVPRWADLPLAIKGRAYVRRDLVYYRIFWRKSHPPAILAAIGIVGALRWRPALLASLPWLIYRMHRDPVAARVSTRLVTLPSALALDLTEVVTMARGSLRHRTILL